MIFTWCRGNGVDVDLLVVGAGAGAVGGYAGAALVRADRSVTFLVHPATRDRLHTRGIEVRGVDGALARTAVEAVTSDALSHTYDVVLLAVRSDSTAKAIEDFAPAVGPNTVIIPVANGVAHLDLLAGRFGRDHVYGGVAQLAASLAEGVIREIKPGIAVQIGRIDGRDDSRVSALAQELTVDGIVTTVSTDVAEAMWAKFAFITATASLTCLLGDVIGPIVRQPRGLETAMAIVAEVAAVADAAHHRLSADSTRALVATQTDAGSSFGPSMFRDMTNGRVVESAVLAEFASFAQAQEVPTPLLDAALVAVTLHNARVMAP